MGVADHGVAGQTLASPELAAWAAAIADALNNSDTPVDSRIATAVNGLLAATLADAKGDLLVATAADTITRLAVGTNGYVLTASSGDAAGVKWATPEVQYAVNVVGASGATETLPATYVAHKVTMDQGCTFTFSSPTLAGHTFLLYLVGAFTPTFPASVDWDSATPPTYTSPALYSFTTFDTGANWLGSQIARGLA